VLDQKPKLVLSVLLKTRLVHGLSPSLLLRSSFVNRRRQKHYGGQESTMEDRVVSAAMILRMGFPER
jgi:hypothetical protein